MFRTIIKLAVRNFRKERFFSLLNIAGLSVGIAVVMLIALYIQLELGYDTFHRKHELICRIAMHLEVGGSAAGFNATFPPLAEALRSDVPEVEEAVRLYTLDGKIFKYGDKLFTEDKILYADPGFFNVFDFKVIAGNARQALERPYQVLLTPRLAKKYFDTDNWAAVIGNSILINQEVYAITGIVEEAPANSHVKYSSIVSIESTRQGRDRTWDNLNVSLYALLRPGAVMAGMHGKVSNVLRSHVPNFDKLSAQGIVMEPIVQALQDIHLHSDLRGEAEPGGSMLNVYVFGTVAGVVLLLACVNFVNLLTARSANRAKEVGIRKVLGSAKVQLIQQFILECILLVAIATLIALGIVELMRKPFTTLLGKPLPFDTLLSPQGILTIGGFVVLLGILAGSYPAFFLSSFKPAQVLKGKVRAGFRGGNLRNALVMIQFVISMVLITCTLVVQRQLTFMRSKKLGFDKENVLVIDNANRLNSQKAFIDAITQLNTVKLAGAAMFRPVDDYDGLFMSVDGSKDNRHNLNFSRVDHDYLNVMKYEFVEGRNFSRDTQADSAAVIINESAAKTLYGNDAVGKPLEQFTVIGVVKDFNFESLKNEVRPLVFFLQSNQRFVHVRLEPGNYIETIAAIEAIWKKQTSDVPFTYAFLDETYNNLFREEVKLGNIFSIFTGLALFIACLGLVGLAAYMAEQRKKEISVRKVLGASLLQVVALMSGSFVRVIAVALIAAVPIAYYVMKRWLDEFAYKTTISWQVLVAGGLIVMTIALLTVSYQAIRAALLNPVDSLKEE